MKYITAHVALKVMMNINLIVYCPPHRHHTRYKTPTAAHRSPSKFQVGRLKGTSKQTPSYSYEIIFDFSTIHVRFPF